MTVFFGKILFDSYYFNEKTFENNFKKFQKKISKKKISKKNFQIFFVYLNILK